MGFSKDLVIESGSEVYLKTPPGVTKVRVVSDPVKFWKDFEGKKRYMSEKSAAGNTNVKIRYSMWVIDRQDGSIKVWETSGGMVKDLQNLSTNPEFAFDNEFPYDIIITRVGTTQNDTRYTINAARQNTPLTDAEKAQVAALMPIADYVKSDSEDVKTDGIPF